MFIQREANPKWAVVVFGAWHDVIALREYREELLEQKPDSSMEDFGEWRPYRLKMSDPEQIAKAIAAAKKLNLQVELECETRSPCGNVVTRAMTANGYDRKRTPVASVSIDEDAICMELGMAIQTAIDVLRRVNVRG